MVLSMWVHAASSTMTALGWPLAFHILMVTSFGMLLSSLRYQHAVYTHSLFSFPLFAIIFSSNLADDDTF